MIERTEVTIYDIAAQLNVSPATVSRGLRDHPAISKKTKKRILDCAKKLGYRYNAFASNLRRRKSNTIGVIVPRLNSSFMSDIIAGIEKITSESGYNTIISQSLETEKKEIINATTMYKNMVDGLLISLAYDSESVEHFKPFIEKNIPVIFFDRVRSLNQCSTIVIDNFKAAYDITSHLIDSGCKRIMHIGGNLLCNVYNDRFNGYKKSLADHHLLFNPDYLIINHLGSGDGIEAAHSILQMSVIPDAVFVANDNCAANCMIGLKKNGIHIPEDICFAGFNNDSISSIVEPNLTTIDYRGFEMGEIAAKILIDHLNQIRDATRTETIVLRHKLIIRESSMKPVAVK
ncbi:MAG TPA: LacI family DNA-binding transcriptional regulator [Bacteroidales bacterium]|nr:LacI family DNA-binding transcriptional regulator [Bacteroidales bacterium]